MGDGEEGGVDEMGGVVEEVFCWGEVRVLGS